jgi:hypothetical protein
MRGLRTALAILAIWCVAFAVGLHAHDLARSESVVTVRGPDVRARLTLDLLAIAGVDTNGDGDVSYGELDEKIDRIYAIIKDHFTIRSLDPPVRTTLERYAVRDGHVGQLDLLFTFDRDVTRLSMTSTLHRVLQPTHEHLTRVSFGADARQAVLDARMPEAAFGKNSEPYSATIVLGLLAAAGVGCVAVYQLVRRAVLS